MEEELFFASGEIQLEGLLTEGDNGKGVVITHPHPLYGGDMRNPVVNIIGHAYAQKGYTVLKFNFRGVGRSRGRYDNGNGEKADLAAALNYLSEKGVGEVDIAGYSFGAWIAALLLAEEKVDNRLIMVAPAVAFLDFGEAGPLPSLELVIAGEKDFQFAPADRIKGMLPLWNPGARFEVIRGADHFFFDEEHLLEELLASFLARDGL